MRAPTFFVLLTLTCIGCGGGGDSSAPLPPPAYDPGTIADEAIRQLDKNGNGTVEGSELDASPGLKSALASIDASGDKKLSADELKLRFEAYRNMGVGSIAFNVKVIHEADQPFPDATVTLIPETYMGKSISEATARTGADGVASNFTVGGLSVPGIPPGVYRISVTKDGTNIPARFNSQTTLGCEVFPGRGGSTSLEVKISAR